MEKCKISVVDSASAVGAGSNFDKIGSFEARIKGTKLLSICRVHYSLLQLHGARVITFARFGLEKSFLCQTIKFVTFSSVLAFIRGQGACKGRHDVKKTVKKR